MRYPAIAATALVLSLIPLHAQSADTQKAQISRILETFQESVVNEPGTNLKITKLINFQSEHYANINKALNIQYTYPQGFQIDEHNDALYVLRYSNGHPARCIIEKYRWSSGSLITTYIVKEPQASTSESIIVDHLDGQNFLYIRSDNKLAQYRLIEPIDAFGSTEKITDLYDNVAQSFYRKNNIWYLEKYRTNPDMIGQSRGEYSVADKNFKHVKDISFPAQYAGYRESKDYDIPKHQGFAVMDDGYIMSMGGFWSDKTKTGPYNYYGVNIFNADGSIRNSYYLSPKILFSELAKFGIHASRNENEGIQVMNDGSIVVLQVLKTKEQPTGQLAFIKFSLPL